MSQMYVPFIIIWTNKSNLCDVNRILFGRKKFRNLETLFCIKTFSYIQKFRKKYE